ncbi:MAG: phosphatidylserine decarboxylase family protein [Candidatus Babeliales bacterium]|nr:phosphatidylserine decarboxylase family protein [Candidatus Babeliales bacterium]
MFKFLINNLLWQDGKYIAIFTLFIGLLLIFLKSNINNRFVVIGANILLLLTAGFFLFSFYFFRNPDRVCKEREFDNNILVSPCDGLVVTIEKISDLTYTQKISVFLSPIDVHVNWIPDDGIIEDVIYRPGKFIVAFAPKSSDINERNDIVINCKKGKIQVGQIAGFVARRICCWVKKGDNIKAGTKFGMIRFGSRVDIFLPENVEIKVNLGQKIKGGQTAIGRWL